MVSNAPDKYPLGRSEQATERLMVVATQMRVQIQRFLEEEAGIAPGMKVLDVGCGAGDVSLLAGEIVGPSGSVLGIDVNASILETARSRAQEAGLHNVTFQSARIPDELDGIATDFDALVGRRVLCYIPSPVDALRALLTHVRSDGIVAFQEIDHTVWSQQSYPRAPYFEEVMGWIKRAFEASETEMAMGTKLCEVFTDTGLPEPAMRAEAGVGPGVSTMRSGFSLLQAVRETILREGIATEEDIDPDTVRERMARELAATGSVVTGGFEVRAWARKP